MAFLIQRIPNIGTYMDCSTTTFQTDADGESSCDFTTCEAASTATAVEAFAESNEVLLLNILVHLL